MALWVFKKKLKFCQQLVDIWDKWKTEGNMERVFFSMKIQGQKFQEQAGF